MRIIARLDIKGPNLIKGVHLEGLRVIGPPVQYSQRYYEDGVDELLYMDSVASLYGRNLLHDLVTEVASEALVPITVGGGIRTLDDAAALLRIGADKVAINTAAVARPQLLAEIASQFGNQATVLSIEAKRTDVSSWEVLTHCGRERTGMDVVSWARRGVDGGAGEILLTSVDQEGTRRGFDIDLIRAVVAAVPVPVVASGGLGSPGDLLSALKQGGASAVAVASALHYGSVTVTDLRAAAQTAGFCGEPRRPPRAGLTDWVTGG